MPYPDCRPSRLFAVIVKNSLFLILLLLTLSGCSKKEQNLPKSAKGEEIFRHACLSCHQPGPNGSIFQISTQKNNLSFFREHIRSGSWVMPAFPQLSDDELNKVADYALSQAEIIE
jgi:mono/diheme cytochrome c family protein